MRRPGVGSRLDGWQMRLSRGNCSREVTAVVGRLVSAVACVDGRLICVGADARAIETVGGRNRCSELDDAWISRCCSKYFG